MTAIWQKDAAGWSLLNPAGFPSENELHTLVEEAPQLLPLSGRPKLAILGREVSVSTGSLDLLGVEADGRVDIIEVKLRTNTQSRREIVAQALDYAAAIHGMGPSQLEQLVGSKLATKRIASIADAAVSQGVILDSEVDSFNVRLAESLSTGQFRIVLVLDSAPFELQQLVAYLSHMTQGLTVDLITVAAYDVGGTKLVVPQLVAADVSELRKSAIVPKAGAATVPSYSGTSEFVARLERAQPGTEPLLRKIVAFADGLDRQRLAAVGGRLGGVNTSLLAEPLGHQGSFFSAYVESTPAIHRSVLERLAPNAAAKIDEVLPFEARAKQTPSVSLNTFADVLLPLLEEAYKEVATNRIPADPLPLSSARRGEGAGG